MDVESLAAIRGSADVLDVEDCVAAVETTRPQAR